MSSHVEAQKSAMNKNFNETAKRSTRERLIILLNQEESMYKHWLEMTKHRLNPTAQKNIERRFNKRISALKIVIYMLTPYFERDYDEPTFLIKKAKQ